MIGKYLFVIFIIAATLIIADKLSAAPIIAGATSTISSGQQVTLSGQGFGTKSVAPPLIWDNFEAGTSGSNVAGNPPTIRSIGSGWVWEQYHNGGIQPVYTNTAQKPNSNLCSLHDFVNGGNNISLQISNYPRPNTGDEVYFTFYWKMRKTTTSWSRNIKPWQEYGSSSDQPMAYVGWGNPSIGDGALRSGSIDNSTSTDGTLWGQDSVAINNLVNEWIRIEVFLKQSAPSTSNGAFHIWIHRPFAASPTQVQTRGDSSFITRIGSNTWKQWMFGEYFAKDDPSDARGQVYIDDIYFDNTRARIELCDNSVWANRTHCEIQIPLSWSDNAVTATGNRGAFGLGTTAYLYVVDSSGTANSLGYPITIGATDQIAPLPPTNLQITN